MQLIDHSLVLINHGFTFTEVHMPLFYPIIDLIKLSLKLPPPQKYVLKNDLYHSIYPTYSITGTSLYLDRNVFTDKAHKH